jgi:hydrogenase-1 operon protein HyaF
MDSRNKPVTGHLMMNKLTDNPVHADNGVAQETGNAIPQLHEIRQALVDFLESGRETVIDLGRLPMGPGDEAQLLSTLGNGEVVDQVTALGKSIIRETRLTGVWLVEHFNTEAQSIAKLIAVSYVPDLLKAPPEDIREGLAWLIRRLAASGENQH